MIKKIFLGTFLVTLMASCVNQNAESDGSKVVNVYSHRHYKVDKELYKQFEEQTGIHVNVVSASSDELLVRLENEKENTQADLFMTVDAARLWRAKQKGLLSKIEDVALLDSVLPNFKDKDAFWTGLTYRARIIVADTGATLIPENYADLAKEEYKGTLVMRSSENEYNQSLLSGIAAHVGLDSASNWASKVVANFARDPKGNDRDQVKSIAAGMGKYSVVNTYYLGKMAKSKKKEEREALKAIQPIFPDQEGNGVHVNISGAGLVSNGPNKVNAIRLLQFLLKAKNQQKFAEANHEYPVNGNGIQSGYLAQFNGFKIDTLNLEQLGMHNADAVNAFSAAEWH